MFVCIAVLSVGVPMVVQAAFTEHRTTYLTFSGPVALPGVALARGTYVFELAAPQTDPTIVRVLSRDRSTVYFMAFTEMVPRPPGGKNQRVSLGEAGAGHPVPILAWYPDGDSSGRRFIYRDDRVAGLPGSP
jgi:hypothetical protein